MQFRGLNEADRSVECIASSEAIDSYGEIVDQNSLKLGRYLDNPVVLFGHNSRELPIGRASNVRVDGGALRARIHFASTTKAEETYQLVQAKILRGVSIGFVPGRAAVERRAGKDVTVLYDGELHELSVVPIPANPEALLRAKAMGLVAPETPVTREYIDTLWEMPTSELSANDEALLERAFRGEHFPSINELVQRTRPTAHERKVAHVDDAGLELAVRAFGEEVRHCFAPRDAEKEKILAEYVARIEASTENGQALAAKIFGGGDK